MVDDIFDGTDSLKIDSSHVRMKDHISEMELVTSNLLWKSKLRFITPCFISSSSALFQVYLSLRGFAASH